MKKNIELNWVKTEKWEMEIDFYHPYHQNLKLKFSIEKKDGKYLGDVRFNRSFLLDDQLIVNGEETYNSLKEAKKSLTTYYKKYMELQSEIYMMENLNVKD